MFKKLYSKSSLTIHDGTGYIQGSGFTIQITKIKFLGFTFLTDMYLFDGGEWTRDLRRRLKADEEQEARELAQK